MGSGSKCPTKNLSLSAYCRGSNNSRAVYPEDRRLNGRAIVVEIIGPPESGKTSLLNALIGMAGRQSMNLVYRHELQVPGFPSYRESKKDLLVNPEDFADLIRYNPEFYTGWLAARQIDAEQRFRSVTSYIQFGTFVNGLKELKAKLRAGQNVLYVIERGPNDLLAQGWNLPLIEGHKTNEDFFRQVIWAGTVSHIPDAVICFTGAPFSVVSARRVARGEQPEGHVVKEADWPRIIGGYAWWRQYFYPVLQERFGTGLLVLDGNNPLDVNIETALEYVGALANSLEP